MSEKVTIALRLERIVLEKVRDWCSCNVVLTTLSAVVAVLPHVSAEESVQRITLEQALLMFEESNLELRLVAAERDQALGDRDRQFPAMDHIGLHRLTFAETV